jgi:hypothetical protein
MPAKNEKLLQRFLIFLLFLLFIKEMASLANKGSSLSLTGLQPATTPFLCWQVLAVLAVLAIT